MGAELPAVLGLTGMSVVLFYMAVNVPDKYKVLSTILLLVGLFTSLVVLEIVVDETGITLVQTMYADSVWLLRAILFLVFIDFFWQIMLLFTGRGESKPFSEEVATYE